jgi:protein tyrosine/serine phosphatase
MLRRPLIISLIAFAAWAAEAPASLTHVKNLGSVNEHLLRGAEPTAVGLTELGAAGVKVVIDLRETGLSTEFEKHQAEKLGMKYTNVPLPPASAPSQAQIQTVLNLIMQNQSQKVFLHCRRGKDRTGTVVACYRIQHDGWQNQRALEEAKEYGMSRLEVGMRSLILHFTPQVSPTNSVLSIH